MPRVARRGVIITGGSVVAIAAIVVLLVVLITPRPAAPAASVHDVHSAAPRATASVSAAPPPPTLTAEQIAALPEARYDAVISGLIAFDQTVPTGASATVYHPTADVPLFGADRIQPVARLAGHDFLGQQTTTVGIERAGDWTLVLTPARDALPSKSGGQAAAQTTAWVPTADLVQVSTPTQRLVISTEHQTVTITNADGSVAASFGAGVDTAKTPTPTQVTGYLEQRYVDPSQGTGQHPIQLTSLHSGVADDPYGGHDGGLIGVHYFPAHAGAVSHGCVRLDAAAITAINALPLGTLVTIT